MFNQPMPESDRWEISMGFYVAASLSVRIYVGLLLGLLELELEEIGPDLQLTFVLVLVQLIFKL